MTEPHQTRILLAEDDDAMRTYLERALEKAGYAVDSVDRGTAALPLLETNRYDLLLSDIVLPKWTESFITGFAAVTLKASRDQPQARVLSKPFHLKDLVLEVERVLEDRISASL